MAGKLYESKMLGKVRRWRKEAYQKDRTKIVSERLKDDKKLANKFNLPSSTTTKAIISRES
jgi:hypothetical protein